MGNLRDANILNLASFRNEMDRNKAILLRAYWEELRAGRAMPLRSEIDPREIASSLDSSFMIERTPHGEVRFRLSGMALNDLMGMDVRGMPLKSIVVPEDRPQFTADLDQVFLGPEIQRFQLYAQSGRHGLVTAELMILPLKTDQGDVSRGIGCLICSNSGGSDPLRFRLSERVSTPVDEFGSGDPVRTVYTRGHPGALRAERPTGDARPSQGGTGQPVLRLVK